MMLTLTDDQTTALIKQLMAHLNATSLSHSLSTIVVNWNESASISHTTVDCR